MNANDIEKSLLRRIAVTRDNILTEIIEKTTSDAQKNFDKFERIASTDNPRVSVSNTGISSGINKASSEVQCFGEQVIFLEFGVGSRNSLISKVVQDDEGNNKLVYGGKSGNYPASGFAYGGGEEKAERPAGVYPLGYWQGHSFTNPVVPIILKRYNMSSHGADDFWVRPSSTGIPKTNIGEREVHKRDSKGHITGVRDDVVWTAGHPPARALYRASRNAIKQIIINRMKRR